MDEIALILLLKYSIKIINRLFNAKAWKHRNVWWHKVKTQNGRNDFLKMLRIECFFSKKCLHQKQNIIEEVLKTRKQFWFLANACSRAPPTTQPPRPSTPTFTCTCFKFSLFSFSIIFLPKFRHYLINTARICHQLMQFFQLVLQKTCI